MTRSQTPPATAVESGSSPRTDGLFDAALQCLRHEDPAAKTAATAAAASAWREGALSPTSSSPVQPIAAPGRPQRPRLVAPRELARRSAQSQEGRAALIHSLCHIEFNAINLAWDAVYRFREMPREYYDDWVRVAEEEAYHFTLLREHLNTLGHDYGDFDAHDGLWEAARETAHDPLVRMALVPRVLEARGLDVAPGIADKLHAGGDERAVAILDIIQRDEVGHVAIGSRWFNYLCAQRGLAPAPTFRRLLDEHMPGRVRGPLHRSARIAAGFTEQELDYLEAMI
ncbi:MAG TPA: ferritin-like domain-containing protein [Gammaproteobacteria bacterium]|nr:ferritin-like domain-containing protein [Gammaproteobacteria bacterium]